MQRSATVFAALITCLWTLSVSAQRGQEVAPYVPTVMEDVRLLLDLAQVGPGDYVLDLGSGDGRIVIEAARRGAMGHGVEIREDLVQEARRAAARAGVGERTLFLQQDLFTMDIRHATVVTLYLMPDVNLQLRPKLLADLQPGTRVVSNSFHMGDWQPDARVQGRSSGGLLLWIVPAQVAGEWRLQLGADWLPLTLTQSFQQFGGALHDGRPELPLQAPVLRGRQIAFGLSRQGR